MSDANIKIVLDILNELKEATTAEILKKAANNPEVCPDRLVTTLNRLKNEGKVKRTISKKKRGIVWSLGQ